MTRLAYIAALIAAPALAADYPERIEAIGFGGDSIEIVADGPHRATVRYTNSAAMNSAPGKMALQVGEIIVDVVIDIGSRDEGNKERAAIQPRDGFISIPTEAWAEDGETVTFIVTLPMF